MKYNLPKCMTLDFTRLYINIIIKSPFIIFENILTAVTPITEEKCLVRQAAAGRQLFPCQRVVPTINIYIVYGRQHGINLFLFARPH